MGIVCQVRRFERVDFKNLFLIVIHLFWLIGSSSPHLGMNSPNLAPNPGARLGNSPLNNLNAMNSMNAPSMGSPINQNPHVMKNNGQMCPPMNNLNSPLGNGTYLPRIIIMCLYVMSA